MKVSKHMKKINKKKSRKQLNKKTKSPMKGGNLFVRPIDVVRGNLRKSYEIIPNSFQYNLNLSWRDGSGKSKMSMAQFKISDENISGFQSLLNKKLTEMDCFVNAMQLIGIFDRYTANILRITCTGKQGVDNDEMEMAFILHNYLNNPAKNVPYYDYFQVGNFQIWAEMLAKTLHPGHVAFCGYFDTIGDKSYGHVFLIGKYLNGETVYLDPQVANCKLNDLNCVQHLKSRNGIPRTYWSMFKSDDNITSNTLMEDLGFDVNAGR